MNILSGLLAVELSSKDWIILAYVLFTLFLIIVVLFFPYILTKFALLKKGKKADPSRVEEKLPLTFGSFIKQENTLKTVAEEHYSEKNIFLNIPDNGYDKQTILLNDVIEKARLYPVVAHGALSSAFSLESMNHVIRTSKYALVDVSVPCDSVTYKLGLLHGLEKETCLLVQEGLEQHVSFEQVAHIKYKGEKDFAIRIAEWLIEHVPEADIEALRLFVNAIQEKLTQEGDLPFS